MGSQYSRHSRVISVHQKGILVVTVMVLVRIAKCKSTSNYLNCHNAGRKM